MSEELPITHVEFCGPCVAVCAFDAIGCFECGCPAGTVREVDENGTVRITFPNGSSFTCEEDAPEGGDEE